MKAGKLLRVISGIILIPFIYSCSKSDHYNLEEFVKDNLNFALEQYLAMEEAVPDSLMPRSFSEEKGLIYSGTGWWCSGFFPGTLWYLYDYSGDTDIKDIAHKRTMTLEKEKANRGTHDLGFMLYCSFGNGLRLTGNKAYRNILLEGSESLLSRYNETIGCIRSWDHGNWQFPVIIDNMMNLEFLYWAARESGDSSVYQRCLSHTNNTMEQHYRPDFSSFHLVDYDTITGKVLLKQTVQGYSDESSWARGQAWGLYGFTNAYRETKEIRYLDHARGIASFILQHPNLPEDMIPYWDFNAPGIPDEPRDASAAAIISSALLELSGFVEGAESEYFRESAIQILKSLASPDYRAVKGTNGNFILKHSVGSIPHNSEIDVPLTYADYYFVEALMRLREML